MPPLIFYSSEHEIGCGGDSGGSGGFLSVLITRDKNTEIHLCLGIKI